MNYIKMNTVRLNRDMELTARFVQNMRAELERMKQSAGQLDSMWDGPGSEAFKKAFWEDMGAMEALLENLDSTHSYGANAGSRYESCERNVSGIVAAIRV